MSGETELSNLVKGMKPQLQAGEYVFCITIPELAKFMKSLGVEKAMNLDGGSSSSFYYKGQTFYGKVDSKGNWVKRPVKSVLVVFKEFVRHGAQTKANPPVANTRFQELKI